jgi:signal transduction histidine kinase
MAAINWQANQFHKRTGIECRVACVNNSEGNGFNGCEDKLEKTISINLFRIFQEALTNVVRHSGASSVEVELQPGDHEVVLSISDNGCGLSEGHTIASTSYGIRGMRERVKQLHGKIKFSSPSGGGFCVTVKLPLPVLSM